jgi:hypothetical protein
MDAMSLKRIAQPLLIRLAGRLRKQGLTQRGFMTIADGLTVCGKGSKINLLRFI